MSDPSKPSKSSGGVAMYQDFSGVSPSTSNPYDALIQVAENNPAEIQARYESHRHNRNGAQKEKLLSTDFEGVEIDPTLYKLLHKAQYPDFKDERYCMVFWARPTQALKSLIKDVQDKLLEVAPSLWTMPPDNLHMTAFELAHSKKEPEIEELLKVVDPKLEEVTDYTFTHRTRLVRPMIGFDASALALTFVPAIESIGGEGSYTYHHLRRDLFAIFKSLGIPIGSRYVVPSAHLTIARFVSQDDTSIDGKTDRTKMQKLVEHIEKINAWLKEKYWEDGSGELPPGAVWDVGAEKGLDCNKGTLWYGYSQRVRLGKGY